MCQGQQQVDGRPALPALPKERREVSLPQPKLSPPAEVQVSELSDLSIFLVCLGSFVSILLLGICGYFSLNR